MADAKISALSNLTGVAATDEIPMVDVSDTTQASSGSTKSPTAAEVAKYVQQTYQVGAAPSTPGAGVLAVFGESVGGRSMLSQIGPSGVDVNFQPHQGENRITRWSAIGNSTTVPVADGGLALSAQGTPTASNVALTNLYTSMKRLEYLITVASTTAVASWRQSNAQWCRGAAPKIGGFHYIQRWGPATGVSTTTSRAFVGMHTANAPGDTEPSTLTNMVGMGWDAADTNIQMMTNDGAGTATKVDLGASFPVPTVDRTKVYELAMFCPPNGTTITYSVTDLVTDAVASGTLTTDLPVATTFLAPKGAMSVGGTSSVIGICFMTLYLETDF